MINIKKELKVNDLEKLLQRFWILSGEKIDRIKILRSFERFPGFYQSKENIPHEAGPNGHRVFNIGSAILQFDATGEKHFLEYGRQRNG